MISENYTKVPNELLEAIINGPFNATQIKIVLTVIRYTLGFNRADHNLSVGFLAKATDTSRRYISKELQNLIDRKILLVLENYTVSESRKLQLNFNVDEWEGYRTIVPQVNNSSTDEEYFSTTGEQLFSTTGEQYFTQEIINKKQTKKKSIPKNADTKKPYETYFDEIWKIYPRKKGKSNVSEAQKKKLYKEVPIDVMAKAINKYKKEVQGIDEKFIKHGSSFFNTNYVDYIDDEPTEKVESKPIVIGSYDEKIRELEEVEKLKHGLSR